MAAHAALYLPYEDVDLVQVFGAGACERGATEDGAHFRVNLDGDLVLFSVMPEGEVPGHLDGLRGYIDALDAEEWRKRDARRVVGLARTVLGLVTEREFEDNHAIWQSLFRIADRYDGYVFVYGSVLMPEGQIIIGPLRR
ncbi:MAG: hypothetical protein ACQEXJ_01225 [Myxococcota bacterium]